MTLIEEDSILIENLYLLKGYAAKRFLTGSRIIGVSRMRNEKYAIWLIFMDESPKFLHVIGNRGRRTRW